MPAPRPADLEIWRHPTYPPETSKSTSAGVSATQTFKSALVPATLNHRRIGRDQTHAVDLARSRADLNIIKRCKSPPPGPNNCATHAQHQTHLAFTAASAAQAIHGHLRVQHRRQDTNVAVSGPCTKQAHVPTAPQTPRSKLPRPPCESPWLQAPPAQPDCRDPEV
jgi:hypothetical protein